MAKAQVTFPDGRTAIIEGPTQEAVQAEIDRINAQIAASAPRTKSEEAAGGLWNLLAGPELALAAGSSAISEPVAGLAGLGALMQGKGMDAAGQAIEDVRGRFTYQPRTEWAQAGQGLLADTIGKYGEWADETGEGAMQATGSPAVGAAVSTSMQALPMMFGAKGRASATGRSAGVNPIIDKARSMGYTLEPTQVIGGKRVGGPVKQAAAASGKHATAGNVSVQNQAVTNRLVAQDIGAPNPRMITKADIRGLRDTANRTYTKIKANTTQLKVQADAQYQAAIQKAIDDAADAFTGTKAPPAVYKELTALLDPKGSQSINAVLTKVEKLRRDARVVLNKSDDPKALALARSRRAAADALEDAVGRALQKDAPNLLPEYQAARQQLAKLHNVEDAWSAGGNIDAVQLAKLRERGAPLTGALNDIADMADNFPHVMRSGATMGRLGNMGALDWAMAVPTLGIWPAAKMAAQEFAPVRPYAPKPTLANALLRGEFLGSQMSAYNE